jgi:hypothetical protein
VSRVSIFATRATTLPSRSTGLAATELRADLYHIEVSAGRCAVTEGRRKPEVESAIDEGECAAVARDRGWNSEQVGRNHVDDLAARQIRRELQTDQGVSKVLDHPRGATLKLEPVECPRK